MDKLTEEALRQRRASIISAIEHRGAELNVLIGRRMEVDELLAAVTAPEPEAGE